MAERNDRGPPTSTEPSVLLLPAIAADDFVSEDDLPHELEPWLDAYEFEREIEVRAQTPPSSLPTTESPSRRPGWGKPTPARPSRRCSRPRDSTARTRTF